METHSLCSVHKSTLYSVYCISLYHFSPSDEMENEDEMERENETAEEKEKRLKRLKNNRAARKSRLKARARAQHNEHGGGFFNKMGGRYMVMVSTEEN